MPLLLAVHGAAGRMGRRVVALAAADARFQLVGAIDHSKHPALGQNAGDLAGVGPLEDLVLSSDWPERIDVVIDFSLPEAVPTALDHCTSSGWPLVIATTGLDDGQKQQIFEASRTIPIVWAP
ncbi:MAG: 4-hydroxy-tetrahydrodipicolinate reductase, partial [Planctomycetales bacterium]|nr:4-hydroxy-tetrahydrodipicolinate reductase [Planctomycetales bacterium]